jgi:hypothetical protein
MQHQQQTYYEQIEAMQHLYVHSTHIVWNALVDVIRLDKFIFRLMARSNQGACAPDCYGVVPRRGQEKTAEQPPHAGVLPEA